jgi:HAD superfamily hydrolase (TIGR01549 family)
VAAQVLTSGERWVCLDVGETLVNESRIWDCWADALGISHFTLMAAMGAVLARGGDFLDTFKFLGFDEWRSLRPQVMAAFGGFQEQDLYADAKPTLDALRACGFRLAIVGNQPANRTDELRFLGVRADVMAMSDEMGVEKPDQAFFDEVLRLIGNPAPESVAYVGDRLDNDVGPAALAGLRPVWLKRGPWAAITSDTPVAGTLVVGSLSELVERIEEAWA